MIQQIDLYSKDFDIYAIGEKMNEIIDLLNEKEQTEVNKLALGDVSTSVCYNIECPFDCYKDNECLDNTTCTARKTVC